ncbi:MAG: polymer-forming cytoskeletal protein [Paracoccaceae bacterium]|nr:polymer-forming cytoskeletal protein [Paracoccaceae bacterium]
MSNQPSQADTPQPPRSGTAGEKSVLASDLRITGDIVSGGNLEVMGEIEGSITARALLVSNEGQVNGTITADTVDVRGRMSGKIASGSLTLRSAAQVTAEVVYSTLSIENGAQVEGTFSRKKA